MARSELAWIVSLSVLAGCDLVLGVDPELEPCELGSFTGEPVEVAAAEEFSIDSAQTLAVVMVDGVPFEVDLETMTATEFSLGDYPAFRLSLTPEGNALFYTVAIEPPELKGALRGEPAHWTLAAGVPLGTFAGTPSADVFGTRHVLVRLRETDTKLQEYADIAGRWTAVGELRDIAAQRVPNLTPDGRTMVYPGVDAEGAPVVFAAQRASTDDWFDEPEVIHTGTAFSNVQLHGRCAQLYGTDGTTLRRYDR